MIDRPTDRVIGRCFTSNNLPISTSISVILHNMYNPILGITRSMFVVQGISVIEKADDGTHMQKEYLD